MSDNQGWIKIHRKIQEKGWWNNSKYVHLWIHLLLSANHKPKEFMWNNNIIVVKEGQMITGRKELAKKTGLSESSVERILKCFENEHQIEQQKTTKFRLINIINWVEYQNVDNKMDNKRTTNEQQTDTNKNVKNDKNDKNDKNEKNISRFAPPTLEDIRQYCLERKNSVNPEKFLNFYESKGWMVGKNKMKDWRAAVRTWEQPKEQILKDVSERRIL